MSLAGLDTWIVDGPRGARADDDCECWFGLFLVCAASCQCACHGPDPMDDDGDDDGGDA